MHTIEVPTSAREEMVDIGPRVQEVVREAGLKEGVIHLWSLHTTCALTVNENADPDVPRAISEAYPGHVLEITAEEKAAFAGNCIALNFRDLFISQTAVDALAPEKIEMLKSWQFEIHAVEMDEIEKAGGSLRCCVAEIY